MQTCNICYNVQEPLRTFTGRKKELQTLHALLQADKNSTVGICGFGGVGKSELVKKYIADYNKSYDNIVWINAENYERLARSFREFACEKLDISLKNANGEEKLLDSLAKQVYLHLSKSRSLFIFDDLVLDHNLSNKFLPVATDKIHVVVTSRDKNLSENVKILVLECFAKDEAATFIEKYLDLYSNEKQGDVRKLATTLQLLPLALRIAVALIKKLSSMNASFEIHKYLEQYYRKNKECANFAFPSDCDNDYFKAVLSSLSMTFAILGNVERDRYAIHYLGILAYFPSGNISIEVLSEFSKHKDKITPSIELLQKYALINVVNDETLYVHELVQQATRMLFAENNGEKVMLNSILNSMGCTANSRNVDYFMFVWTHAKKHKDLFAAYHSKVAVITKVLISCGRIDEALAMGSELIGSLSESRDETARLSVLLAEINNAVVISLQAKYNDALREFRRIYEAYKDSSGYGEQMIVVKFHIANVLKKLGKRPEAHEQYRKTLDECKRHFGDLHQFTIVKQAEYADFLIDKLCKYDEALSVLRDALEQQKITLGIDNEFTSVTQNQTAITLAKLGKYDEAMKIYEEIYEYQASFLSIYHPDILRTKLKVAGILAEQGKLNASRKIFEEIYRIKCKSLGEDDLEVINIRGRIGAVRGKQGNGEEALKILEDVLAKLKNIFGLRNLDVYRILFDIAVIHEKQDDHAKALEVFEEALKCQESLLGKDSPATITTRMKIISILTKEKNYNAALKQSWQAHDIRKNCCADPNDLELLCTHKYGIGMIYYRKEEYDKAVKILTQVKEAISGNDLLDCVVTRDKISVVLRVIAALKRGKTEDNRLETSTRFY